MELVKLGEWERSWSSTLKRKFALVKCVCDPAIDPNSYRPVTSHFARLRRIREEGSHEKWIVWTVDQSNGNRGRERARVGKRNRRRGGAVDPLAYRFFSACAVYIKLCAVKRVKIYIIRRFVSCLCGAWKDDVLLGFVKVAHFCNSSPHNEGGFDKLYTPPYTNP